MPKVPKKKEYQEELKIVTTHTKAPEGLPKRLLWFTPFMMKEVPLESYILKAVTITFKPDVIYTLLCPLVAHKKFKKSFSKYCLKKGFSFLLCPEISMTGLFHYHGFIWYKYTEDLRDYKMLRNYINRLYGRNMFQDVKSYTEMYQADDRLGRCISTTFSQIVRYNFKEQSKHRAYQHLKYIYLHS